jgi:hypothetical protein
MDLDKLIAYLNDTRTGAINEWSLERDADDDEILRLSLLARDGERYILRCECDGYPSIAPSILFVNESGWTSDVRAWPTGNLNFVEVVKPPPASFLCFPLTRECLKYHPDWAGNAEVGGWDPAKHSLWDVFTRIQSLLNSEDYWGRGDSVLRRNILLPENIFQLTQEGLRGRSMRGTRTAAIWVGHRVSQRQIIDDVVFLDEFPGFAADRDTCELSAQGIGKLFRKLADDELFIVAQIISSPGVVPEVLQGDQFSPIDYCPGLLAVVIPETSASLARLSGCGVFEYGGDAVWRMLSQGEISERFTLEICK